MTETEELKRKGFFAKLEREFEPLLAKAEKERKWLYCYNVHTANSPVEMRERLKNFEIVMPFKFWLLIDPQTLKHDIPKKVQEMEKENLKLSERIVHNRIMVEKRNSDTVSRSS